MATCVPRAPDQGLAYWSIGLSPLGAVIGSLPKGESSSRSVVRRCRHARILTDLIGVYQHWAVAVTRASD